MQRRKLFFLENKELTELITSPIPKNTISSMTYHLFGISKRWYVIELIVFFGIGDVINSVNSLFSRKNNFLLCIHRICYIEDLDKIGRASCRDRVSITR